MGTYCYALSISIILFFLSFFFFRLRRRRRRLLHTQSLFRVEVDTVWYSIIFCWLCAILFIIIRISLIFACFFLSFTIFWGRVKIIGPPALTQTHVFFFSNSIQFNSRFLRAKARTNYFPIFSTIWKKRKQKNYIRYYSDIAIKVITTGNWWLFNCDFIFACLHFFFFF